MVSKNEKPKGKEKRKIAIGEVAMTIVMLSMVAAAVLPSLK